METDNADMNWYVFYTRSNAEKAVYNHLLREKYDVFLPMIKTLSIWKNRQKKIISRVIFRSYIFVRTAETEIDKIVKMPNIVFCVRIGKKYSIIPDRDIKCIIQMLSHGQELYTEKNYSEGEPVKVVSGPLAGSEGLLLMQNDKYSFGILLNDIKQCACVDIDVSLIRRL
jgi:transcription antitermination factor NusG